jgi:hypothetical protein
VNVVADLQSRQANVESGNDIGVEFGGSVGQLAVRPTPGASNDEGRAEEHRNRGNRTYVRGPIRAGGKPARRARNYFRLHAGSEYIQALRSILR